MKKWKKREVYKIVLSQLLVLDKSTFWFSSNPDKILRLSTSFDKNPTQIRLYKIRFLASYLMLKIFYSSLRNGYLIIRARIDGIVLRHVIFYHGVWEFSGKSDVVSINNLLTSYK